MKKSAEDIKMCIRDRVNVVVEELYAKYPDVASLAAAEPEEIEEIVRPCGLGRSKARDISACMRILHEQYDDNIPTTFEALLKLPGVGRKSANLIMGDVFGKPAIVTDTHCIRLCKRIGLVDGIKAVSYTHLDVYKRQGCHSADSGQDRKKPSSGSVSGKWSTSCRCNG